MDITSFDQWLDTLSTALAQGKAAGLSGEQITNSAVMLGDYLAKNINPDVPENKLLKSLWETGNQEEKQALANMMVKLVQSRKAH